MRTIFTNVKHYSHESNYYEVFTHNERTFNIVIVIANGDPLGFNYKCCLRVMTNDGIFMDVADNRQIGAPYSNKYHASEQERSSVFLNCAEYFKNFVKKVYK